MPNCKYCDREFKTASGTGVHEIQCKLNPNYRNIQLGRIAWNIGLNMTNNKILYEKSQKLKNRYRNGELQPSGCASKEWYNSGGKQKLIDNGRINGGYKPNSGRSKKFKVLDSFGKETVLQSSFELKCSDILNELYIKWIRPKAIKYDNKNYFADFYLPDYDIWLDPKNNYKAKLDKEKIQKVIEQNNIKLYILLEEQINKDYITSLIQW